MRFFSYLLVLLFLSFPDAKGQLSITGPNSVQAGQKYLYRINADASVSYQLQPIQNATVDYISGGIFVTWNSPGNYTISIIGSYCVNEYIYNPSTGREDWTNTCSDVSAGIVVTVTPTTNVFPLIQNSQNNFTATTVFKEKTQSLPQVIHPYIANQIITYTNGLGNPIQVIQPKASFTGNDIVKIIDQNNSHLIREYLTYTISSSGTEAGKFRNNGSIEQQGYYTNNNLLNTATETHPFKDVALEKSPRELTIEMGGQGPDYQLGTTNTVKRKLRIDDGVVYIPKVVMADNLVGSYETGTLLFTEEVLPEGRKSREYRDRSNRLIAKCNLANGSTWATTFYVYDDLNRVIYILQPNATQALQSSGWTTQKIVALSGSEGFRYAYDYKGRLFQKVLPGALYTEMAYDQAGQLVATQTLDQKTELQQLTFFQYDIQGRPVITGLLSTPPNMSVVQETLDQSNYNIFVKRSNSQTGYTTESAFPFFTGGLLSANNNCDVQLIQHYDFYDIDQDGTANYTPVAGVNAYLLPLGQQTITRSKNAATRKYNYPLNFLGTINKFTSIVFYNEKGRQLQTSDMPEVQQGITPAYGDIGSDKVYTYDFEGKVIIASTQLDPSKVYARLEESFDYHSSGKLLTYTANGNKTNYLYNDLGMLIKKEFSSSKSPVEIFYTSKGQVSKILSNSFEQHLYYDTPSEHTVTGILGFQWTTGTTPRFDGNISAQKIRFPNQNYEVLLRHEYDLLGRLSKTSSERLHFHFDMYAETDPLREQVTYDLSGNITNLKRGWTYTSFVQGFGLESWSDDIQYKYSANRLINTHENGINSGATYYRENSVNPNFWENDFDLDGRLISDDNYSVDLFYNSIGRTSLVKNRNWDYFQFYNYSTDGQLRGAEVSIANRSQQPGSIGTNTGYGQGFTFSKRLYWDTSDPTLYRNIEFETLEGKIRGSQEVILYRDHLQSPMVVTENVDTERNMFFSYGARNIEYSSDESGSLQQEGYTAAIRAATELGVRWQLHGERLYDTHTARWLQPDPLAEAYHSMSPYMYVAGNPVAYVDQNGQHPILVGALIGAAIGAATHTLSSGLATNFQFGKSLWRGMGRSIFVGALAGGIGGGVASGVKSMFGGGTFGAGFVGSPTAGGAFLPSFWNGAAIGASGGLAGGFTSGLAGGVVSGNSLEGSLLSGLRQGAIGSLTGGIIGGVVGGVKSLGLSYKAQVLRSKHPELFSSDGTLIASKETVMNAINNDPELSAMFNKWKPGIEVTDDYRYENGMYTRAITRLGGYKIDFYKSAFTSARHLYHTIGHELVHVDIFRNGTWKTWTGLYGEQGAEALSEKAAYGWNYYRADSFQQMFERLETWSRNYWNASPLSYNSYGYQMLPVSGNPFGFFGK